jgi:hypothetical protein
MTGAAWLMLAATWAVVLFFTAKFFWMVLKTPVSAERERQMRDGILAKDA